MDWYLFHLVNDLAGRSGFVDSIVVDWAKLGPAVLGLVVVVAWFALPSNRSDVTPRRLAFLSIVAALLALGIAQVIGHEWFRERPYATSAVNLLVPPSADASFPSDHAVGAFALATPLLFDRRARVFGIVAVVGALLLAFARVFIGTHFPSDVAGGALLGAVVAMLVVWTAGRIDRWPSVWAPLRYASELTDVARRRVAPLAHRT
jgi:undecaprenyl-diphosphatase